MKKSILCVGFLLVSAIINAQDVVAREGANDKELLVLKNDGVQTTADDPVCVYSQGTYANFLKNTLNLYNPGVSWKIWDCSAGSTTIKYETLVLDMIASDAYYTYGTDSRILFRFSDGSVSTLHRREGDTTIKEYKSMWIGNTLFHLYHALAEFDLDTETRNRFLNPNLGILKVRVVLANGNARDYEMTGKMQTKVAEQIRNSWISASKQNAARKQNSDDSTF
ncbi:MAG: hypothetical protein MJZ65_00050 [Paludibacteraceae bacterium]|nr:hypothetical protein [Paludibacteraceae bacterium]